MAKTYRPYIPGQDLLPPPSLREWLPEDHLAFFVSGGDSRRCKVNGAGVHDAQHPEAVSPLRLMPSLNCRRARARAGRRCGLSPREQRRKCIEEFM
jgi:hypothetical protein